LLRPNNKNPILFKKSKSNFYKDATHTMGDKRTREYEYDEDAYAPDFMNDSGKGVLKDVDSPGLVRPRLELGFIFLLPLSRNI